MPTRTSSGVLPAALLVLLPAPAGAGLVAPHGGALGPRHPADILPALGAPREVAALYHPSHRPPGSPELSDELDETAAVPRPARLGANDLQPQPLDLPLLETHPLGAV